VAKGGRRYVRDNRGRFASVGATARGGRLKTASGGKRKAQTRKLASSEAISNTIPKAGNKRKVPPAVLGIDYRRAPRASQPRTPMNRAYSRMMRRQQGAKSIHDAGLVRAQGEYVALRRRLGR
jgi:hypothetical protein